MEKTVRLTPEAARAVRDLRVNGGTLEIYQTTLGRLFSLVLHQSDEIGMSDFEAMSTIRAIDMIRADLRALAEDPDRKEDAADDEISRIVLPGSDIDQDELLLSDQHTREGV